MKSTKKSISIILKKRNARVAPLKLRRLAPLMRNSTILQAQEKLAQTAIPARIYFEKMLKELNHLIEEKNHEAADFRLSQIRVDQGSAIKRHIPRSRGRVLPIKKFYSHIQIIATKQI